MLDEKGGARYFAAWLPDALEEVKLAEWPVRGEVFEHLACIPGLDGYCVETHCMRGTAKSEEKERER